MRNQKEQQKEGNANEKKNQYSFGADDGRLYGRHAVQITAYAATTAKSVSLSTTTYTYDGKVKKPKVTAKDKKGKKDRRQVLHGQVPLRQKKCGHLYG